MQVLNRLLASCHAANEYNLNHTIGIENMEYRTENRIYPCKANLKCGCLFRILISSGHPHRAGG